MDSYYIENVNFIQLHDAKIIQNVQNKRGSNVFSSLDLAHDKKRAQLFLNLAKKRRNFEKKRYLPEISPAISTKYLYIYQNKENYLWKNF